MIGRRSARFHLDRMRHGHLAASKTDLGCVDTPVVRNGAPMAMDPGTEELFLGIAHALFQKIVYDPHYGLSLARRFHHNKPLTILDIPIHLQATALDIPDPETPVGARGVGEPPVGAGYGAVLNAIADAIGVDAFRRAPVTSDVVLMSLTHGKRMHEPLQAHL